MKSRYLDKLNVHLSFKILFKTDLIKILFVKSNNVLHQCIENETFTKNNFYTCIFFVFS